MPAFLLAHMTAAPLGVVFPVRGVILELPLVCTGLWVKTLSRFWTSDGGALAS